MILKTEDDIKKAIKGKATTVACVCNKCGIQYTVSIKTLKKTNKLLCRKCYKKNPVQIVTIEKPAHIKEFKKRGFTYNNKYFDSSWKLAYFLWLQDNNKQFIYQPDLFIKYKDKNIEKKCYPNFLVEGKFIEIKGNQFFNEKDEPYNSYKKEYWWELYNSLLENNVYIMREKEAFTYVKYVNEKYGQDFLKQHKIKEELNDCKN